MKPGVVLPCRGLQGTLEVTSWGLKWGVSRRTAVMDGRAGFRASANQREVTTSSISLS